MTAERWQQIRNTFELALQYDPEDRERIILMVCGEDSAMLAEVHKLVDANAHTDDFLETPAAEAANKPIIGTRLGAYRILEEIGRGGMGAVYLAVRADDEYRQQVAIKVVQFAADGELLNRFRQERQILANLDHPYIAKLLDGGTTEDGRPYIVMEFVKGSTIDEYCKRESLSLNESIELFRKVCSAVHHAHRNGIVHRDLKPGNILVTADQAPKMLDFGIAKILKPEILPFAPVMTRTGMRPMTVDYASPEQVRAEPVTATSDVYTLGVVFYELLTGKSPYGARGKDQVDVVQRICEITPVAPSKVKTVIVGDSAAATLGGRKTEALRRKLKGDLDAIVLKALEKSPANRYQSAELLSEDLARYLTGLPVVAREKNLFYRFSKAVSRRSIVMSAVAILLALATAVVLEEIWRREDAQKLGSASQVVSGILTTGSVTKEVLASTTSYVDKLRISAKSDPMRLREVATLYSQLGDRQFFLDPDASLASYRHALDAWMALPDSAAVAPIQLKIGDILWNRGEANNAIAAYSDVLRTLPGEANERLGHLYVQSGDRDKALSHYRVALAMYEKEKRDEDAARMRLGIGSLARNDELLRAGLQVYAALAEQSDVSASTLDTYAGALTTSDPKTAVIISRRANVLADWHNPLYLRTLATALQANGDPRGAAEYRDRALAIVNSAPGKSGLRDKLTDLIGGKN